MSKRKSRAGSDNVKLTYRERNFTGVIVSSPEADFVDTGFKWTKENRAVAIERYDSALRDLPNAVEAVVVPG
jgi:hypothetical protein